MKNLYRLQPLIIAALAAIIFLKFCSSSDDVEDPKQIIIPEKKGSFEKQEADYIKEKDTVYVTLWKTLKGDDVPVETENPVNDSLASAYMDLKDSLDRFKLYLDAIQIRTFKNTFDDSLINIVINGEVQGKLNFLKPEYTIKADTIPLDPDKNHFLLGGHVVFDQNLQDLRYSINAGIQNTKGHVTKIGYSKINDVNYVMFGKDWKVFSYKRKQRKQQ